MACNSPLPAVRTAPDKIMIGLGSITQERLVLPCGKCTGCRAANAKAWALRCHLENQQHNNAVVTHLTYDDQWLPPTLEKRHLQLFLKRYRKAVGTARPIRFFASGEYGERNGRPHYHAILFGGKESDQNLIQKTWGKGRTQTTKITPALIAYVAGYTAKKYTDNRWKHRELVDPETGEVYEWQAPFLQMSRRPGIGGEARKYRESWREYAIHNGQKMPVPRFLHEAWKKTATAEEIEQLAKQRKEYSKVQNITFEILEAQEKIAVARQAIKADGRKL